MKQFTQPYYSFKSFLWLVLGCIYMLQQAWFLITCSHHMVIGLRGEIFTGEAELRTLVKRQFTQWHSLYTGVIESRILLYDKILDDLFLWHIHSHVSSVGEICCGAGKPSKTYGSLKPSKIEFMLDISAAWTLCWASTQGWNSPPYVFEDWPLFPP